MNRGMRLVSSQVVESKLVERLAHPPEKYTTSNDNTIYYYPVKGEKTEERVFVYIEDFTVTFYDQKSPWTLPRFGDILIDARINPIDNNKTIPIMFNRVSNKIIDAPEHPTIAGTRTFPILPFMISHVIEAPYIITDCSNVHSVELRWGLNMYTGTPTKHAYKFYISHNSIIEVADRNGKVWQYFNGVFYPRVLSQLTETIARLGRSKKRVYTD